MNSLRETAEFLREHDCFEILTHAFPDGDTLGSGYALCLALRQLGKRARVISTNIPKDFEFLTKVVPQDFVAETIVSVDVADEKLLGSNEEKYSGKIQLCIDHHSINKVNAPLKCVCPNAAANCEILYELFKVMNVELTKQIATCLYTGIATDTGCFKYSNTTPQTLRTAADLIELGVDAPAINKVMFDTKTKKQIRLEQEIYNSIEYYSDDRCAIIAATLDIQRKLGLGQDELEGLASIPRCIEGVLVGISMREKEENVFKISVRTDRSVNAAEFCSQFGGGGHREAAGCQIKGTLSEVKDMLKRAVDEVL